MSSLKLIKTLFLFALLVTIGTVGYYYIEGWPIIDSLYMTAITLSTIGFKEVHPLSDQGRIFTMLLIVSGVGGMAFILSMVFQFVLDLRFDEIYGRRKMSKSINQLKNHTIICGFGKMGKTMAAEMKNKGRSFIIIEKNEDKISQLKEKGYLYIIGNATNDKLLLKAEIDHATSLVSTVTTDAENVFITLSARSLNKDIFIISRVFDDATIPKLKMAGANKIVSPYTEAAFKITQSILDPAIDDFFEIIRQDDKFKFQMADIVVNKDMNCTSKRLSDFKLKEHQAMVIGIKKFDERIIFAPHKDQLIEIGDRLIIIGSGDDLGSKLKGLTMFRS